MGDFEEVIQGESVHSVGGQEFNSTFGCSDPLGIAERSCPESSFNVAADGRGFKDFEVVEDSWFSSMFDHEAPAIQPEATVGGPESMSTERSLSFLESSELHQSPGAFDVPEASISQPELHWTKSPAFTEEELAAELTSAIRDEQKPVQQARSQQNTSHQASFSLQSFICGVNGCRKAYKRSYELRRHRKVHSSVRPYSCSFPYCSKSGQNGFVRKDHLSQHLRQVHRV